MEFEITRLDPNNRIYIPKDVLDKVGFSRNDYLVILPKGDHIVIAKAEIKIPYLEKHPPPIEVPSSKEIPPAQPKARVGAKEEIAEQYFPITEFQKQYIIGMCNKLGKPVPENLDLMDRREASNLISQLQDELKKQRTKK